MATRRSAAGTTPSNRTSPSTFPNTRRMARRHASSPPPSSRGRRSAAPLRDREHGGLPGEGGGRRTELGGARHPVGRSPGHTVPSLDRPCESCRRDHAPRPARYCELVELTRAFPPADPRGDAIVCEHELRHRNDGEMRRAHPPLDLELDLQHETAGIDDRAEPARRLRIAAEDVTRLERYHPRLTLRNARDVERERTTIVHPEAQPAGRAPSMQVAVGRVEIQITVERSLR